MVPFKTIMIKVDGDKVSESYYNYCAPSWNGFNLRTYQAVTPDYLDGTSVALGARINFGQKNGRDLTPTEKACFYSQFNIWVKCAMEEVPILVLEHDAYLMNPSQIIYDPRFQVTFFGQHSMEAVMYHPKFAKVLVDYCVSEKVTGPMSAVDRLLGYTRPGEQSRYARPHARFIGPAAPVKSVLDPKLGTSVEHDGTTADRAEKDHDLFIIKDLEAEGCLYTGK